MKHIIFIIVLVSVVQYVQAQELNNTELKNLIQQSFSYFPKLKELDQQVKINEQKVELESFGNQPNVTAFANYNFIGPIPEATIPTGPNTFRKLQFQPRNNISAGLQASYTIWDFGRTKMNILKAKEDVQQAKNMIDYNKNELAAQVANIYYSIIYVQQAISIQDTVIHVLQANKKLMESRFKNGDALKIDILTIQNNIDIEQNKKVDLQNQLQKQTNLLQFATGQQSGLINVSNFDFSINTLDAAELLLSAQHNNAEYAIAKQRIKQAETVLASSKLTHLPTIQLLGSTGMRNGLQPDINQLRLNYTAGVGLSIPLYTGGKLKQVTKIATAAVKQQALAIESLNNQYKKDVQQILIDIASSNERLQTIGEQISIAKEVLQLAQSRYKNGVSTNVELLNANTNVQKIVLAKLQYEFQLCTSKVELARLMGVPYWK